MSLGDITALLWVVFLERVVPGLAFAVPLLRDCAAATYRISAVTRPLAALAQAGVTWLTLCAALNRSVATWCWAIIQCNDTTWYWAGMLCVVTFPLRDTFQHTRVSTRGTGRYYITTWLSSMTWNWTSQVRSGLFSCTASVNTDQLFSVVCPSSTHTSHTRTLPTGTGS